MLTYADAVITVTRGTPARSAVIFGDHSFRSDLYQ